MRDISQMNVFFCNVVLSTNVKILEVLRVWEHVRLQMRKAWEAVSDNFLNEQTR